MAPLDKFPVDESALPRVTISPTKMNEWREVAQDEIHRALTNKHSWYNSFKDKIRDGYSMIADKPNLKAFIRSVPNSSNKDILVRATFNKVTLDEIAYGSYSETSYDQRCAFAHMYEDNFLDGGILHTHETRTNEDPMHFVGVKWVAFRSPAPAVVTSRDFVFFSYEGNAVDLNGHRVAFRFLRTMPMDDVPVDSSRLPPLVRGKISNLHFYRQNGAHVEAYSKAMHSNAGNMPSWVVTKTIAFMYPGVTNMETLGDAKALMKQGLTRLNGSRTSTGHQSISSSFSSTSSGGTNGTNGNGGRPPTSLASANACGVCYHKFKMTRSKRQCHGCSRTACKACTKGMYFFDEQKQMSSTGVVRLRFCLNCTKHARSEASLSFSSVEQPQPQPLRVDTSRGESLRSLESSGGIRNGSGGSSKSLHRVSSQGSLGLGLSLSRAPSQDGSVSSSSINFHQRGTGTSATSASTPRQHQTDNSSTMPSLHRVPSTDSMSSLPRPQSQDHLNLSRLPSGSHGGDGSLYGMKPSVASSARTTQPEAEYSDDEDAYSGYDATTSHAYASTSNGTAFSGSKSSSVFASSKVSNAYEGSPLAEMSYQHLQPQAQAQAHPQAQANPFESSHIGQYSSFKIQPAAGDSEEEEDEEDEDFGDFHDSDSDDDEFLHHHNPGGGAARPADDDEYDDDDDELDDLGDIVDHSRSGDGDYGDTDDYSIAGSFSYDVGDFGAPSFMSSLTDGDGDIYQYDDNGDAYGDGARGSFVPLTVDDKPSIVSQLASSSSSSGGRPHHHTATRKASPPQQVPQRLPPQPTLRTYGHPLSVMTQPSSNIGESPANKSVARTGSTPNLLAYGATKRTHRPGGVGMAPVRRAQSNEVMRHDGNELANGFQARVNLYESADPPTPSSVRSKQSGFQSPGPKNSSATTSPLIRYYGN